MAKDKSFVLESLTLFLFVIQCEAQLANHNFCDVPAKLLIILQGTESLLCNEEYPSALFEFGVIPKVWWRTADPSKKYTFILITPPTFGLEYGLIFLAAGISGTVLRKPQGSGDVYGEASGAKSTQMNPIEPGMSPDGLKYHCLLFLEADGQKVTDPSGGYSPQINFNDFLTTNKFAVPRSLAASFQFTVYMGCMLPQVQHLTSSKTGRIRTGSKVTFTCADEYTTNSGNKSLTTTCKYPGQFSPAVPTACVVATTVSTPSGTSPATRKPTTVSTPPGTSPATRKPTTAQPNTASASRMHESSTTSISGVTTAAHPIPSKVTEVTSGSASRSLSNPSTLAPERSSLLSSIRTPKARSNTTIVDSLATVAATIVGKMTQTVPAVTSGRPTLPTVNAVTRSIDKSTSTAVGKTSGTATPGTSSQFYELFSLIIIIMTWALFTF